jgi:hypothetical protein
VQIASNGRPAALRLTVPIAPGMLRPVPVAGWQRMRANEPMTAECEAGTVALDGERELPFKPGQRVRMTLRENAFFTLNVAHCMAVAVRDGLLRSFAHPH